MGRGRRLGAERGMAAPATGSFDNQRSTSAAPASAGWSTAIATASMNAS
jgi:hypothetical protein